MWDVLQRCIDRYVGEAADICERLLPQEGNGTGPAPQGVPMAASQQAAAEHAGDRGAQPPQAPALCMLLGSNQDGKTSLINMLLSISMETPEAYAGHMLQQQYRSNGAPKSLEAVDRLRKLKGEEKATDTAGATLCTMPSSQQRPKLMQQVDRRADAVKDCIEKARTYKIYEPHFEKTGSLLETGGDAAACTEHPVVVAYGTTPQLLVRFKTQEDIHSILTEHLRVQSSRGLVDTVEVSEVDRDHLAKMWAALTDPTADLAAEHKKFGCAGGEYTPPLKPWVEQLLGRDYIHIGRAEGQEAHLHRELAFLLELLKLHVAVDKLHLKKLQELLGWLADADKAGPWQQLAEQGQGNDGKALRGEVQGLLLMLQRVQLFVPAKIMKLLGVELVDAPGTNDATTVRKVLQRRLEEEVDGVVVLTPRVLSNNEAVLNHLAGSPFLENYVMERLTGADPSISAHHHLSIMLYTEKEGLVLPDLYDMDDSDEEVDLQGLTRQIDALYLQRLPEHIRTKLQSRVASICQEDLPKLFSMFAKAQDDTLSMDSRYIDLLARQPPVFYSLPMLGIALELRPTDEVAMQRLLQRNVQPEQLQAATPTAQHTHFLAALLLPRLEAAEAAIQDAIQVVSSMQHQVRQLAQPVKILEQLTPEQQAAIAKQGKKRVPMDMLDIHFSSSSKFNRNIFSKRFNTELQKDWLPGAVQVLLDSEEVCDCLVSGVVEAVVDKLAAEYNLPTTPPAGLPQQSSTKAKPAKVRQLLHELAPAYQWLHPKAPLGRWVTRAARTALEPLLEGLQDLLLEQLQPQVVVGVEEILQEAFVDWAQPILDLDKATMQSLVAAVLQQRMKLGDWVRGAFRKAFFLNYTKTHTYMTPYRKRMLVRLDQVVCSNPTAWDNLHKELSKAASTAAAALPSSSQMSGGSLPSSSSSSAASAGSDRAVEVKRALRTQLTLLMQGYHTELRDELLSVLDRHFLDLRKRVYETYRDKMRKARASNNIIIPAAKMFWSMLQQLLEDSKAPEYGAALARIKGVQQQLNCLLQPGKLGQLMVEEDPRLGPMVAPALRLARQWLLNQSCWAGSGPRIPPGPAPPHPAAVVQGGSPPVQGLSAGVGAGVAAAAAAEEVVPWQHASHKATSKQMLAMVTHLQQEGYKLEEAGGGEEYNCWLHSVLVQLMGLGPEQVPSAAQLFREMAAVRLERELAAEGAAAAVQGVPGPLTMAIAGYHNAEEGSEAAVHQALTAHLHGLRKNAMLTDVDQAVLARVIDELYSASIVLYSPCYSSTGFRTTYSTATSAGAKEGEAAGLVIRIANVWPEWLEAYLAGGERPQGRGQLNHFVMVVPTEPAADELPQAAAVAVAPAVLAAIGNDHTAATNASAGTSNGGSNSTRTPQPSGSARKRRAPAAGALAAGSAAKQQRIAVVVELSDSEDE